MMQRGRGRSRRYRPKSRMIAKRVKQISEVMERETQDHAKLIKTRVSLTRWEFQRTLAQEEWTKSDPMYQREPYFGTHQGEYRAAVDALVGSSLKDTNATFDQQVVEITGVCSDGPSVVLVVHDADLDEDVK